MKMDFREKITLGRTDLTVGRMGISSSFGAPAESFEEAFEKGCNYFTWGTFIKGRSDQMRKAIRNIIKKGQRDQLVLALFTYAHSNFLTESFLRRGLKTLGIDRIEILLLGYFSKRPSQKLLDGAVRLKEKGLVRFLGVSSHNRRLFPRLHDEGVIDVFHIRYNAANRGAETDIFPFITGDRKPGIVSFTATRWGQLLNPKKMPKGESPLTAGECYRFVLSHPSVDVCMMGAKTPQQMKENLNVLDQGPLSQEVRSRVIKIGDYLNRR